MGDFSMIRGAKLAAYKTPNQNVKTMTGLMQTLLENYNGDFRTMEKKKALTETLTYKDVLDVGAKVFAPSNKRQLAVVYTADDVKLDKLPAQFKPFTKKMGKMVGKSHFKCPVKLPESMPLLKKSKSTSHAAHKAVARVQKGDIKPEQPQMLGAGRVGRARSRKTVKTVKGLLMRKLLSQRTSSVMSSWMWKASLRTEDPRGLRLHMCIIASQGLLFFNKKKARL